MKQFKYFSLASIAVSAQNYGGGRSITDGGQRPALEEQKPDLPSAMFGRTEETNLPDIPRNEDGSPKHMVTYMNLSASQERMVQNLINERMSIESSRDFGQINRMAFWHAVLSKTAQDIDSVHDIPLTASMDWFQSEVRLHGCYCWPDENHGDTIFGFGKPKDYLDTNCFDLYQCYRCVNQMPHCTDVDWVNHHYSCAFTGKENGQVDFLCSDAPGSCGKLLCECDKAFAQKIEEGVKQKYQNPNGAETYSYVFPDGCPRAAGFTEHKDSPKKCCGTWPQVKSYHTNTHCCGKNGNPYLLKSAAAQEQCVNENYNTNSLIQAEIAQNLKEDPEFAAAFNKGNENQNPNQQAGENEIRNFNATFNVNHEEFHAEFPGISEEDHQMAHSANQEWDESNNNDEEEQDSMVKVAQQHTKFHADNPNMADDAEEHEALHEELDARMARLMDFAA